MNILRFEDLVAQGRVAGKRVFIRADLNVPLDAAGHVTEDTRIRASIPCIQMALKAGAAVMVTSHLGRPTEGDFKPADSGQIELYLRWLDRHERQPTEEAPLGIILCAGKKRETVEYLDLGERGIHVAEYLTELPPREVLRQRFHLALATARARVEQQRGAQDRS